MTIDQKRKALISEELKNKEYREEFVSSSIDVGVGFQIRALRKQKKLTQEAFADTVGMAQERISALENSERTPNISTLKRIANALQIGLVVRFVSIGKVLDWHLKLSPEALEVPSFNEDPYFEGDEVPLATSKSVILVTSASSKTKIHYIEDYQNKQETVFTTPGTNAATMSP